MKKLLRNAVDAFMELALRFVFGTFMFGVAMLFLIMHIDYVLFGED